MERKGLGRIIIVGGFAAEFYSGRSYRTGDVDIIVEGKGEQVVKEVLSEISERGLRIFLPKIKEISEKGIDIVGNMYNKAKPPLKLNVDEYHIFIIPPEELIITYLEAWKYWDSLEDRNKAVLVYCAWKKNLDIQYVENEAKKRGVKEYYEKMKEYC